MDKRHRDEILARYPAEKPVAFNYEQVRADIQSLLDDCEQWETDFKNWQGGAYLWMGKAKLAECVRNILETRCRHISSDCAHWKSRAEAAEKSIDVFLRRCDKKDVDCQVQGKLSELTADRDSWKSRAEALERAFRTSGVCGACVYKDTVRGRGICKSCRHDSGYDDHWEFDMTQFVVESTS